MFVWVYDSPDDMSQEIVFIPGNRVNFVTDGNKINNTNINNKLNIPYTCLLVFAEVVVTVVRAGDS